MVHIILLYIQKLNPHLFFVDAQNMDDDGEIQFFCNFGLRDGGITILKILIITTVLLSKLNNTLLTLLVP